VLNPVHIVHERIAETVVAVVDELLVDTARE